MSFEEYKKLMLAKTFGSAVYGVDASTITIEVNVGQPDYFFINAGR